MFFSFILGLLGFFGQGKVKGGAAIDPAVGPNASTMTVNDALDVGQTNAGAGKFRRGVEALESPEELACGGGVEPGAVVADEKSRGTLALDTAEFDAGEGLLGGKLH